MKELFAFNVKNGENDVSFSFKEPTKMISREAELLYAKTYADCVRQGLLTNAEALKINNQNGGIFTDSEKDEYIKSLTEYLSLEKDISAAKESGQDCSEKESEHKIIKDRILSYQSKYDSIFEFTAESKARDTILLFYALSLTYSGDKLFFEGKDFSTRMKNIEEKTDDFRDSVLKRAIWYATAMFYGVKSANDVKYPEQE